MGQNCQKTHFPCPPPQDTMRSLKQNNHFSSLIVGCIIDLRPGLSTLSNDPFVPSGCSIHCSRTFGTLFWNDIKWSAHGVLKQCLVYYICVQPCITIFTSYSHNKSYNDLLLFVYLSMLLQRFYSLILPNPGVQIAYNKYMSKYSG